MADEYVEADDHQSAGPSEFSGGCGGAVMVSRLSGMDAVSPTHHRVASRRYPQAAERGHGRVDKGNTVIVIEHKPDVIKTSDWIVDMGPEGGAEGGTIVTERTPEDFAAVPESYTGKFLAEVVDRGGRSTSGATKSLRKSIPRHLNRGDDTPGGFAVV
jgi:hypothetical protein